MRAESAIVARDSLREEEIESRWEAAPAVGLVIAFQLVLALVSRAQGWKLWALPWWVWLISVGPETALLVPLAWTRSRRQLEQLARNAWPARVARDGTLHVHTSSSAWAFELGQLEARIKAALGELAPQGFRFAVGPLPEPPAATAEEAARTPVEPSPEHRLRGDELAAEIVDENLRKVVAKAAALSLAKADSDRMFW